MAKVNKEYQWRMDGMVYAHKLVKEGGIEALEKDIKMRNFLKVDIWARKEDVENLEFELSTNLYNSMLSTFLYTLHHTFDFGKTRIKRLKDAFDINVGNIFNIDWVGNNYVRFEDYAKFVNERLGMNFDVERIALLHEAQFEGTQGYKQLDREATIADLKEAGFEDAAEYLKKRIYDKEGIPAC